MADRLQAIEENLSVASDEWEIALALLHRASRLRHAQREDFLPLGACHQAAEKLLHELTQANKWETRDVVGQLAKGEHPLAALLELL